jgi:hypothetical protein
MSAVFSAEEVYLRVPCDSGGRLITFQFHDEFEAHGPDGQMDLLDKRRSVDVGDRHISAGVRRYVRVHDNRCVFREGIEMENRPAAGIAGNARGAAKVFGQTVVAGHPPLWRLLLVTT